MALGTNLGILASVTSTPVFSNTYSLDFDGVDDYINIGNAISYEYTDAFSYSFWVNPNVVSGVKYLYSKYDSGRGILMYYNSSGAATPAFISFNLYNTNAGSTATRKRITTQTGNILTKGVWNNIVITYDGSGLGSGIKLYKNGVSQTVTVTQDNLQNQTIVNTVDSYLCAFNGISSFFPGRQDEFAIFNSELSAADALAIYGIGQPTDLTSLSPVAWYRMGDNGTYKSPQFLIPNNENKDKVSNYSTQFDGIDDYFDLASSVDLGINNTISAWVKRSDILNRDSITGESSYSNGVGIYIASQQRVYMKIGAFITFWYNVSGFGILNQVDTWFHLAIVRQGNDATLYLNGSPTYVTSGWGTSITTKFDRIGAYALTGGNPMFGNLDEIAGFDSALTDLQINDIYNGGEPTTLPSGAVAHYKMGEEANFTSNWLVDNSALSNYSKRSFDFDGVDDYLSVSDNSIGQTQNISYSIWVNLDVTTRQYIIGNQNSSNGGCGLQIESGDVLVFQMADGTNDSFFNSRVASFSTYAPINTWNHILATWDGTDSKIYINGVLRNTWTPTLPYTISGYDTTFNIGWRAAGFSLMTNGKLDELALFNTAISIGDVWDGSGQPIDVSAVSGLTNNWRMGEDASFNGTNWTVPDNLGTSTGTSANMTVDSLVGEAANYSGGGISSAMTIEDRVGEAPSSSNNAISFNMESVDRTTDVPI